MQILGLLGMHFDAVVVKVKTFLLLFRLALAILWLGLTGLSLIDTKLDFVRFCLSFNSHGLGGHHKV